MSPIVAMPHSLDPFLAAASVPGQSLPFLASRSRATVRPFEDLVSLAEVHGTLSAFLDNLARLSSAGLAPSHLIPDESFIRANREREVFDLLRWETELARVLAAISEAGLSPPVLLKGGSLRYQLYPEPWMRPCNDIDLMLPEGEVDAAAVALLSVGFAWDDSPGGRTSSGRAGRRAGLRGTAFGVEIHRYLDYLPRKGLKYGDFVSCASPVPGAPPGAVCPGPVHHLCMAVIHALHHGLHIPLKNLVDIHLLVERGGYEWNDVEELTKAQSMTAAFGFLLSACVELFGTQVPAPVLERLRPSLPTTLLLRVVYSPWREGFAAPPFTADSRPKRLLAHLLLTSGWVPTARYVAAFVQRRIHDWQARR